LPPHAAAFESGEDAVEAALAQALQAASDAGRWDVVARIAGGLVAGRESRAKSEPGAVVVALDQRRKR
jgi:hypothetical protein